LKTFYLISQSRLLIESTFHSMKVEFWSIAIDIEPSADPR